MLRWFAALTAASVLGGGVSACGGSSEARQDDTASAAPLRDFEGAFRVRGKATETSGRFARDVWGWVILTPEDGRYAATFELRTVLATDDGPIEAKLFGRGSGTRESDALVGSAETQLIRANVPGVDSDFAYIPRSYEPRRSSRFRALLEADGSVALEITSEGTDLPGARTELRGVPAR